MSVNVEFVSSYKNYGRCLALSNPRLRLLVTLDVGPRIISMTLDGGENLLWNDEQREMVVKGPEMDAYFGPGATYRFYGGHRLWLAPQHEIHTCVPDNDEVSCVTCENGVILTPRPMDPPGVQAKLTILLDPKEPEFSVAAQVQNISYRPRSFALWQITQMAPGGLAILPFHRGAFDPSKVLVPRRQLSVFDITDMRDPRMDLGNDYITLRQEPGNRKPFKIGTANWDGWCMYIVNGTAITKRFDYQPDGTYTDGGVNCELYTGHAFLEIESLGTYDTLAPMSISSHTERFSLRPVPAAVPDAGDEQAIASFIKACGVE